MCTVWGWITKKLVGHHKASADPALEAVSRQPKPERPIALQSIVWRGQDDPGFGFSELPGYPSTKDMKDVVIEFDRNQTFGYNDQLNYHIISNWVRAEHK